MHHDYERVKKDLDAAPQESPIHDEVVWIGLRAGDTVWDPVHEDGKLYGPGTVEYRRHPDGGITAIEHGLANSGKGRR